MVMLKQVLFVCGFFLLTDVFGYRFTANSKPEENPQVINLFSKSTAAVIGTTELEKAFNSTYKYFEKQFDTKVVSKTSRVLAFFVRLPHGLIAGVSTIRARVWAGDMALGLATPRPQTWIRSLTAASRVVD